MRNSTKAVIVTNRSSSIPSSKTRFGNHLSLYKPENHIKVRGNQQVERQVPTRTVADMVNEMEGELTELPKYTAMAKILQGQTVWKGKIKTLSLPSDVISKFKSIYISKGNNEMLEFPIRNKPIIDEIIEDTQQTVCSARTQIEREIRKRQEKWKLTAVGEPRVVRDKNEKGPAGPQDKPVVEPDGPPPTSRPKPRR